MRLTEAFCQVCKNLFCIFRYEKYVNIFIKRYSVGNMRKSNYSVSLIWHFCFMLTYLLCNIYINLYLDILLMILSHKAKKCQWQNVQENRAILRVTCMTCRFLFFSKLLHNRRMLRWAYLNMQTHTLIIFLKRDLSYLVYIAWGFV
jgi:hypothetical protein